MLRIHEFSLAAKDFETLTVADSVKQVTAAKIGVGVFITVETAAIRYTMDGTDPVAGTTGHVLAVNGTLYIVDRGSVLNLKMIRDTGTSAVIQVTHY